MRTENFADRLAQSSRARSAQVDRVRQAQSAPVTEVTAAITPITSESSLIPNAVIAGRLLIASIVAPIGAMGIAHMTSEDAEAATASCKTSILVTRSGIKPFDVVVRDPSRGDAEAKKLSISGAGKYDLPEVPSTGTGQYPDARGALQTRDNKMWKVQANGSERMITIPCLGAANDPFNYAETVAPAPTAAVKPEATLGPVLPTPRVEPPTPPVMFPTRTPDTRPLPERARADVWGPGAEMIGQVSEVAGDGIVTGWGLLGDGRVQRLGFFTAVTVGAGALAVYGWRRRWPFLRW